MPAFERIYRLFERPVYTLALRLLGDRDEAQEILHDTMLKLFQNIDSYRGDSPFWGWLRQIAANESLMRLRKRARLAYVEDVPEPVEDEPSRCCHRQQRMRADWSKPCSACPMPRAASSGFTTPKATPTKKLPASCSAA